MPISNYLRRIHRAAKLLFYNQPRAGLCINSGEMQVPTKGELINNKAKFKVSRPIDYTLKSLCVLPPWKHPYQPSHFANNGWNEFIALKARILCPTPKPNVNWLKDYRSLILDKFDEIFPHCRKIKSVSFEEYLRRSNATRTVKMVLANTKVRLDSEGITEDSILTQKQLEKWTMRKCFVKIENACYLTPVGRKNKAPRLISGAQPEFIVLVGPWIMAVQDAVKRAWNIRNPICFSSGLNGEQIGKWASKSELPKKLEDDIGKFDASCNEHLLKSEAIMFDKFGAPTATSQLIHSNVNTRGKTRFGISFSRKGGRKSGDPYTSLGNSIINALIHVVSFMKSRNYSFKEAMSNLRMLVQGDDNVLFHTGPEIDWKKCLRNFGFEAEGLYKDNLFKLGFCSGIFLPVDKGVILSPKPGKVLMKFGVFCNASPQKWWDLIGSAATGAAINMYHIKESRKFLGKYSSGAREYVPEWSAQLANKHEPNSETQYWLDFHYYKFPRTPFNGDCIDSEWERIFDLDTDGPKVYYTPVKLHYEPLFRSVSYPLPFKQLLMGRFRVHDSIRLALSISK